MASDKPFYKLTIKLDSARADALAEAIQQLRDIASDYDTAAQSSATLIFESYQEAPIIGIREQFELWLHRYQIGLGCEVTQKSPGVRPETILALRAMHRAGDEREHEPLLTPSPLMLSAPNDTPIIDAELVEVDE